MRLGETEFLIRHDPAEWNAKKLGFSIAHPDRLVHGTHTGIHDPA